MFRFLKYFFVMNRLRHARNGIAVFIASAVMLVLFVLIASDITPHVDESIMGYWLIGKWGIVLALIAFMGMGIRRIFILFTRPFGRDQESFDRRKESILAKEVLMDKSQRIIAKYKQDKQ